MDRSPDRERQNLMDRLKGFIAKLGQFKITYQRTWKSMEVSVFEPDEREAGREAEDLARGQEEPQGLPRAFPVATYIARAHGDYGATFVSENIKEKTGYEPEDFIKDPEFWANHLHPADRKFVFAKLPSLMAKGHWMMQYRFRRKDWSYCWMFEEASLVYDEEGLPKEIVGYWGDISELARVAQAARDNEARLKSVFAAAPTAITCSDLEGKIIDCNQATLDMHGYASKSELFGKSALDLIAARDRERALLNMERTLAEGAVKNVEYTFLAKDGREFPAELSAAVVRDIKGQPASFMAVTMDISSRKRAEKESRGSEERLKVIFEEAPDAYFLLDLHGVFIDCNRAAERLTGYARQEIIGKNFLELRLLPPEQVPLAFEGISEALERKITGLDEYTLSRKDRTQAVVEIKAKAVNFQGKDLMLAIVRDVTARRLAEQDLAIKDQLVESSAVAVAVSDPGGALSYVNDAFLKMWGYNSASDVLGRSAVDFWKEKGEAARAMAAVRQAGSWEGKLVARNKVGSTFEAHVSARLAKGKGDKPIGITASLVDQEAWRVLKARSASDLL